MLTLQALQGWGVRRRDPGAGSLRRKSQLCRPPRGPAGPCLKALVVSIVSSQQKCLLGHLLTSHRSIQSSGLGFLTQKTGDILEAALQAAEPGTWQVLRQPWLVPYGVL